MISDALNHASIIDGIRLCKAQRYRYRHLDMTHLEELLKESVEKGTRQRMIVTDGVFSMDGDIAPLRGGPKFIGGVEVLGFGEASSDLFRCAFDAFF